MNALILTENELIEAKINSPRKADGTLTDTPTPEAIKGARPPTRGLLLIYSLDHFYLNKKYNTNINKPVIGLALSFPSSPTAI